MKLVYIFFLCLVPLEVGAQNIFRIACNGDLEKLDSALQSQEINVLDDQGRNLLHWAAGCKKPEIVDYLVEKEIDFDLKDDESNTPLHYAADFGNAETLTQMIALEADDEWTKSDGGQLLGLATQREDQEKIDILLAEGVEINSPNRRGSTALEIADRFGYDEMVDFLISKGADSSVLNKALPEGKYMGEEPPGKVAKLFAPGFISTEEEEFGSVFNKAGDEFYFGVHKRGKSEIRFSELKNGRWTEPKAILIHPEYGYNDPFLSQDENRLYFISNHPISGKGEPKEDIDIWFVERQGSAWSKPIHAGWNINTESQEYYISFTEEGKMYFSSSRHASEDEKGWNLDIYTSEFKNGEFQPAIQLGSAINSDAYEADVFVDPKEEYVIFCSERDGGLGVGDLYISFKDSQGNWSQAKNMGEKINSSKYEYCPFVTEDGKYLFYTSNQDIYWISTDIIQDLKNER